jgi:hypothetical protein
MKKIICKLTFLSLASLLAFNFANAQSGIGYYVQAENPAAYIQAIEKSSSLSGSANIQTVVSVAVANGPGAATHFVSQQGDTLSDIDNFRKLSLNSPEFSEFNSAVQGNRTLTAEVIYSSLGVDNGKASVVTSPNAYSWHIHLLVTDIPAYLEALEELMDVNDGDVYMQTFQTFGTGLGGGNIVVVNSANSLEELLTNNKGYDVFIEKTIDIRTPIANGIYQTIASFD